MGQILYIISAFLLDLVIGDPYSWPHPVKLIGNYIEYFQKFFSVETKSSNTRFALGILLWLTTVGISGIAAWLLLYFSYKFHPAFGAAMYIYLSYTTLAIKSLAKEGRNVYLKLAFGSLTEARKQVGMIVGRDTEKLSEKEIVNATVETIAENTSDGVIAPLLYLFIGGPVLAVMYKAINTLDSMVGYQTPKYKKFGWLSAKMDDLWNFLPARVSWGMLLIAAWILRMDVRNAFEIGRRDCQAHKSPNSGYPESVAAGALRIQLGGTHDYHGISIYKPFIGDPLKEADKAAIYDMNRLLYAASASSLLFFSITAYVIQQLII